MSDTPKAGNETCWAINAFPQFIQKRRQTVVTDLMKAQRQWEEDKVRSKNYEECVDREKDWKQATEVLASALDQKRAPKKKADEWAIATLKLRKAIQNAGYKGYWDIPQSDDPRWESCVWLMRDASQEEIRTLALSYHTPKQDSRAFNAEWTVIAIQFWPPFERYRVLQDLRGDGITLDNRIACDNRIGDQKGYPVDSAPTSLANTLKIGKQKQPVFLRNAKRDSWVAQQRQKMTPVPWNRIYDDCVEMANRRGWGMPTSVKGLQEAYTRYMKRQRINPDN
jgi:hypothetical protein